MENKKYVIIAEDKTHIDKPKRIFIQDNLEDYNNMIDWLSQFWNILYHAEFNDIWLNGEIDLLKDGNKK